MYAAAATLVNLPCYLFCFSVSDFDQLNKIMAVMGSPGEEFVSRMASPDAQKYVRSMPQLARKPLATVLAPTVIGQDALDLMERMLVLDPDHRLIFSPSFLLFSLGY